MTAEEHHYACPQCGANMRFAPGEGKLKCDHCGHEEPIGNAPPPVTSVTAIPSTRAAHGARQAALAEHDYHAALANALPPAAMEETRNVTCPACGATFALAQNTHAAECPFCATPVVADSGSHRQIKPQAVVPFRLSEKEARAAMTKWLGRLWFAPGGLVDYARKGRAMNGIYVPYWTFDAATRSRYRGQRGIAYYETRTVTVNVNGRDEQRQEQVRKIRWYPVAGEVARQFDDVLALASASLPSGYVDALEPWDLTALAAYSPDYLAGFRAEGYTIGLKDGHAVARQKMDRVIADDVRRDIGGDEQLIEAIDTEASNETFKHVLLPIWMAAYKYQGRSYRFVVNGQTGSVRGERPWSVWKIVGAAIAAVVVVGVVVYLKQNS